MKVKIGEEIIPVPRDVEAQGGNALQSFIDLQQERIDIEAEEAILDPPEELEEEED